MKYIALSLAAGFTIIGIHQVMLNGSESIADGITTNYWLFMMAITMLFAYQYLNKRDIERGQSAEKDQKEDVKPKAKTKTKGKTRKKPKKIG